MLKILTLAIMVLPGGAAAQDWQVQLGAPIRPALEGRTLFVTAEESWGSWRVEGDWYCSQWPPRSDWDCYVVSLSADGAQVRFTDPLGRSTTGTFAE